MRKYKAAELLCSAAFVPCAGKFSSYRLVMFAATMRSASAATMRSATAAAMGRTTTRGCGMGSTMGRATTRCCGLGATCGGTTVGPATAPGAYCR
jgi:hypothetical protein